MPSKSDSRGGWPSPPQVGETTFFRLSDMAVLGTESQRRRQAKMARLEGTGKDPLGRYGKGEIFDVPDNDPLYEELIDKGFAKSVDPKDDPGRTVTQIASAVVQNQPLSDPVDAEIAAEIGDRAHDIVHTDDPKAKVGAAGLDPDNERPQDSRQRDPRAVTAGSLASSNPAESDRRFAELENEGSSSRRSSGGSSE